MLAPYQKPAIKVLQRKVSTFPLSRETPACPCGSMYTWAQTGFPPDKKGDHLHNPHQQHKMETDSAFRAITLILITDYKKTTLFLPIALSFQKLEIFSFKSVP